MKPPIAYVLKHNAAPEHCDGVIGIYPTRVDAEAARSFELRYSYRYPNYTIIDVYDRRTLRTYREWNDQPRTTDY